MAEKAKQPQAEWQIVTKKTKTDPFKEEEKKTTPVMGGITTPIMGEQSTPASGGNTQTTQAPRDKVFPPLGMTVLPIGSSSHGGSTTQNNALTAQRRLQQVKPFAATVVKDWYNQDLKNSNEFIYNKLNGCFRSIQSNDFESSKYWLTQIENMVLSMVTHYNQEKEKVQKISKLVHELCKYSTTTQSSALTQRMRDWFLGASQDQQQLRSTIQDMDLSDLVSLPIQEFCSLLEVCQVKTEKSRLLEAELTVQRMINLNQQLLIGIDQLRDFFKQLEATDIISLPQTHDLIWNKNKFRRIIFCYQDIRSCAKAISMGLVHEILVKSSHPEEYEDILPPICVQRIKAHSTKYQVNFFFRISSIWEERKYLKFYSSIQLWKMHSHNPIPSNSCTQLPVLDLNKETMKAAKEFFNEAYNQALSDFCTTTIEGNILFFDYLEV